MRPLILVADGEAQNLDRTAGAELATCNTIDHPTNRIDVTGAIRTVVAHQLQLDVRRALAPSGER